MKREDLAEFEDRLNRYEESTGYIPNSFFIMAHWPELVRVFTGLTDVVLRSGEVARGLKSLVAHVASSASGCRYCQAHTALSAAKNGIDAEKVAAVWDFETDSRFSPEEGAALRLARDGAQVPNGVTGQHFSDLSAHFSERQIVEIVAVISLFGWFNRWNDIFATELETTPLGFAQEVIAPSGWEPGKHGRDAGVSL